MTKLTRQLARTTNAQRVSWLAHHAFTEFGGLNRFAAAWHEHLKDVSAARPGSRETLNSFAAIINLSAASAALDPPRRPDDMSDAELEEHMQALLTQKLVANLEDILTNLQRQGWIIEPPDGC